jgi:glycosyltransferase involved in cell wall biosynthesis
VLEAMQVGTPVICAHAASLPEVAGDAALWVTPGNEQELAAAISRVLESPTLRVELSVRAARRSRLFSWDETARLTLAAFGEARELYALAGRPTPPARLEAAHSVP